MAAFESLREPSPYKLETTEELFQRLSTPKSRERARSSRPKSCKRPGSCAASEKELLVRGKKVRPAAAKPEIEEKQNKPPELQLSLFPVEFDSLSVREGQSRLKRIDLMRAADLMDDNICEELTYHIQKEYQFRLQVTESKVISTHINHASTSSDDEGEDVPKSSFTTYLAEGDKLYVAGEYQKALMCYRIALEIQPTNVTALVARSKCHLQIGDAKEALRDAESSLAGNKDFHKGLYQKAEALYQMGDFEFALVHYHRGNKLRPELEEFRLGIQKAQEAISNCVGTPSSIKLESKGDLSFFNASDENKKNKPRLQYRAANKKSTAKATRGGKSKSGTSHRTAKVLLGELYADKEYLEKLLRDEDLVKGSAGGMSIYDLVTSGINYLDTRTEFWRQQKPMYARKRDRMLMQQKWTHQQESPTTRGQDPTVFILKSLEDIDQHLADGKASESLELATSTLRTVEKLSDNEMPNKADVVANLHSCIGNAYLELGQTDKALVHHKKDLEIAKKNKFQDARSRALDNLGRVHARVGNFQQAISCWEEKIPLSKSALENTWLFHEIGRCYLEIGENIEKAREYGQRSFTEAMKANDQVWELNAGVLIAQAEVKLKLYDAATLSFERSLETARLLEDDDAVIAITKAMDDVQEKKETPEEEEEVEERRKSKPESRKSFEVMKKPVEVERRRSDEKEGPSKVEVKVSNAEEVSQKGTKVASEKESLGKGSSEQSVEKFDSSIEQTSTENVKSEESRALDQSVEEERNYLESSFTESDNDNYSKESIEKEKSENMLTEEGKSDEKSSTQKSADHDTITSESKFADEDTTTEQKSGENLSKEEKSEEYSSFLSEKKSEDKHLESEEARSLEGKYSSESNAISEKEANADGIGSNAEENANVDSEAD